MFIGVFFESMGVFFQIITPPNIKYHHIEMATLTKSGEPTILASYLVKMLYYSIQYIYRTVCKLYSYVVFIKLGFKLSLVV